MDSLSGAFMMVRREAIDRVGLLDEDFFMYGEDIDWCYRIKENGYKVVYYGDAQIIHYKGGSGRDNKALYEFYNAMQLFYDKHYRNKHNIITNALVHLGIWSTYTLKRVLKNI